MSIEAEITVTLASVEVADDYRLALTTREPVLELTHTEAEQLAAELLAAVAQAKAMLEADFPVARIEGWEAVHHAFDVAPLCRDCGEGKHAACIGSAFVEADDEVVETDCGCAKVDHQVHGSGT